MELWNIAIFYLREGGKEGKKDERDNVPLVSFSINSLLHSDWTLICIILLYNSPNLALIFLIHA